jgi:NAD(P)-dependent dehydrogenase (short-subunit alcohol dehydrogenase family)
MTGRFDGKTAIITGGAKGIGRATAVRFLREGGRLAVLDQEAEESDWVQGLRREVGGGDNRLAYLSTDVTDEAAVEAQTARALEILGGADILVNNVGLGKHPDPIEAISREEWDRYLAINVTSAFLVTRAVLPAMRVGGGGRIVNLASVAGRSASALSNLHYATSKAAIMGFTRKLAWEEGPNGIRVNAVAPGIVYTERIKARYDVLPTAERDAFVAAVPLRRLAEPEEIASVILFLASDDASYITGAVLDVNGGRLMA